MNITFFLWLFDERGKLPRENAETDLNSNYDLIQPDLLARMITAHDDDRTRIAGRG